MLRLVGDASGSESIGPNPHDTCLHFDDHLEQYRLAHVVSESGYTVHSKEDNWHFRTIDISYVPLGQFASLFGSRI